MKFCKNIPNIVLCSAKLLERQLKNNLVKKDIYYIPNGVNLNDFVVDDKNKYQVFKKEVLSYNKKNLPILWFYWTFWDHIDYDLLKYLCYNGEYFLLLIGSDNNLFLKNSGILNLKNVLYLGYKQYDDLKYYSKLFDVGLLPYIINDHTNSASSVKFFQYLWSGVPCIATNYEEIGYHKDFCFIWKNHKDFKVKINNALLAKNNINYIKKIKTYSKDFQWDILLENLFKKLK